MERFAARKAVVAAMEAQGLLAKVEDHVHMVPHGDRSGVAIEPWLTEQWYVNAAKLAEPAIKSVEDGKMVFVPKNWDKTFFHWMRNIEPWCISRQLWWGHQVPAWYGPDDHVFVELDEAAAKAAARQHYGKDVALRRDSDVLDTWFSSALWPFSTLGWPDQTPELKRYYPTSVLVTGFDIIFFWVARMMMMGLHFMKEVPFRTIYIHGIVRDERGHKMSKSKGNVVDPLELIDKYGADALRFTMAALATPGRDVKPSAARIEGYRNFATKLWNAARYAQMNGCVRAPSFDPAAAKLPVNRWILGELRRAAGDADAALADFRFNDAANALYHFTWGTFCDWYLEFTKPVLNGADAAARDEARATTAYVLGELVKLLHPFIPFITEEIWEKLGLGDGLLMLARWPSISARVEDAGAKAELDWVVQAITEIRALRSEMNVPGGARLVLGFKDASAGTIARLTKHADIIRTLARLERIEEDKGTARGAVQIVVPEATLVLPLAGVIDAAAERGRLGKEIGKLAGEIDKIDKKLANPAFLAKADPEVVEDQRERRAEAEVARTRLATALERLGAL
jgi:valyl-tRNA synthetase